MNSKMNGGESGDGRKKSKCCQPSSSVEEANGGDNMGGEGPLKKGPWTSAEDAILVEYVRKHGEGNWNAVQKYTGLARCGKSCRLRWANHLRPDLKKGAFTQEEEQKIIELHAQMGNKWARMAAELPGRTDNEIKNYWNTRTKRRQRAGLPIYPPAICLRLFDNNQESPDVGSLMNVDRQHSDLSEADDFNIPDVEFKNLKYTRGYLTYGPTIFSIPESSMFEQAVASPQSYNMMSPTMTNKHLRKSDAIYNSLDSSMVTGGPAFNHYVDYSQEKVADPRKLSSSCNPNLNNNQQFYDRYLPGIHASLNDNTSSVPVSGDVKLELPSFQYLETQNIFWGTSLYPVPSLESIDTLIQSPAEQTQSDPISPQRNGLLESVVYGSKRKRDSNGNLLPKTADNCLPRSSTLNPCNTQWEEQGDPFSPVASVLTVHTPISVSSVDEPQSVETIQDHYVKQKPVFQDPAYCYPMKKENVKQIELTRPDAFFDLDWFGNPEGDIKDEFFLKDALGALGSADFHSYH